MRRVVPVESLMIAAEELPPEVAKPLVPHHRMVFDTKRFLYYFRLSPDGKRMLFGGRPKKSWKPTSDKAKDLRKDMLRVYPQLEKYAIEYVWFGKVCFTVDRFPIIGERDGICGQEIYTHSIILGQALVFANCKNQRPPAEMAPAPSRGHPHTPSWWSLITSNFRIKFNNTENV